MPTPYKTLLATDPNAAYKQAAGLSGDALKAFAGTPTTPTTPTTTPTPPVTTSGRYDTAAAAAFAPGGALDTTPAESEQVIRDRIRSQMQNQIDAINLQYQGLKGQQEQINISNAGQTRASSARGGLLGSTIGNANASNTEQLGQQQLNALAAEQGVKIAAVFGDINKQTNEKVAAEKARALGNTEKYLAYLNDTQTKANEHVKTLAAGGVSLDALSTDQLNKLLDSTGMDKIGLQAYYNANKPADKQVKYQYQYKNGKMYAFGVDPVTHTIAAPIISDLPAGFTPPQTNVEYNQVVTPDGQLILTPKNFDKSKPIKDQIIVYGSRGQFSKATDTEQTKVLATKVGAAMTADAGSDGYLSPDGYKKARNYWVSQGGLADDFDKRFSNYVNPTHASDYSLKYKSGTSGFGG